MTLMEVS